MQASSVKEPFDSPDWVFETKTGRLSGPAAIYATADRLAGWILVPLGNCLFLI
jgi:hypothetical protein